MKQSSRGERSAASDHPGPTPTNAKDSPKPKKHRVALACDRCRGKKIRCDGATPVCGSCSKRTNGTEICSWHHGLARMDSQASLDQISHLQKQIHELQQSQGGGRSSQNFNDGLPRVPEAPTASNQPSPARQRSTQGVLFSDAENMAAEDRATADEIQSKAQTQTALLTTSPTPGSGSAMVGSVTDADNIRGLFGSSSAGSFISLVRKAVSRKFGSSRADNASLAPSVENAPNQKSGMSHLANLSNPAYVLPPRRKADVLLDIYWSTTFSLYPLVDPDDLRIRYDDLWKGGASQSDENEFLCLLNSIFAISTLTDDSISPENRSRVSKTYLKRAQDLLDLWKPGSLQAVQTFLTLAQYLQSTNEPHQCWMFAGYAVRTAQSLGLHLPETTERISSVRQRELCRRVWHGCILMDRYLAMTYGRPPSISGNVARASPAPSRTASEALFLDSPLIGTDGSILDFFVFSLGLFEILNDILQTFYGPGTLSRTSASDEYRHFFERGSPNTGGMSILDIDQKLSAWDEGLPKHLRYNPALPQIPPDQVPLAQRVLVRQSTILRQRFLHIRILSLRPILANFVTMDFDDSEGPCSFGNNLSRRLTHQCAVVCVKVAQEAIDLVHQNFSKRWNSTGVTATWWYNVFYVYSAATVLIASQLKASIMAGISQESISRSWQQAMEILDGYTTFDEWISKLGATLHVLFNEVPIRYNVHLQQTNHGEQHNFEQLSGRLDSEDGFLNHICTPGRTPSQACEPPTIRQNGMQGMMADSTLDQALLEDVGANFDPNDLSWLNAFPFDFD